MDKCDVGVVLVNRTNHSWATVVPQILIYDNPDRFEVAVRRIIDRQLAIKRLHECFEDILFTPAAIIMDGVTIEQLNLEKVGVPSKIELEKLFCLLEILVEYADDTKYNEKLFPLVWDWITRALNKQAIRSLSRSGSAAIKV